MKCPHCRRVLLDSTLLARKLQQAGLIGKEILIVTLFMQGKTRGEIGRELGMTLHNVTVRLHFAREKLGAMNDIDLVLILTGLKQSQMYECSPALMKAAEACA